MQWVLQSTQLTLTVHFESLTPVCHICAHWRDWPRMLPSSVSSLKRIFKLQEGTVCRIYADVGHFRLSSIHPFHQENALQQCKGPGYRLAVCTPEVCTLRGEGCRWSVLSFQHFQNVTPLSSALHGPCRGVHTSLNGSFLISRASCFSAASVLFLAV